MKFQQTYHFITSLSLSGRRYFLGRKDAGFIFRCLSSIHEPSSSDASEKHNSSTTTAENKIKRDERNPNSPIGLMDRVPKKSETVDYKIGAVVSEPLKPYPDGVNPKTGEIGGPAGPEPTRYGDWERKGRVSDF